MFPGRLGFVQKQVPDRKRISNKTTLTLTLSRPTGERTGSPVSLSFQSGWIRRPTEDDSPSPIRWERAWVRVSLTPNQKLFLHESFVGRPQQALTPVAVLDCKWAAPTSKTAAPG